MNTSQTGIDLIKGFEHLELRAYLCPAHVLTIGYGHTGRDVTEGLVIDEARAEALLRADLERFEEGVTDLAGVCTQNQFDALVSFAFNVGLHALEESTLLRQHRDGKFWSAAAEFGKWTHGGGRVLPGLVTRRAAERALYLTP